MFINDSENEMKKELDVYDWIAENLQKYIQSSSQNEFKNYCSKNLYDIEKITFLE